MDNKIINKKTNFLKFKVKNYPTKIISAEIIGRSENQLSKPVGHLKRPQKISNKNMDIIYTIASKTDGFNSQYLLIMSWIAFCEYKKYKYIHTPSNSIAHKESADKLNIDADIKEFYSPLVLLAEKPSIFYTPKVLEKIINYYNSTMTI